MTLLSWPAAEFAKQTRKREQNKYLIKCNRVLSARRRTSCKRVNPRDHNIALNRPYSFPAKFLACAAGWHLVAHTGVVVHSQVCLYFKPATIPRVTRRAFGANTIVNVRSDRRTNKGNQPDESQLHELLKPATEGRTSNQKRSARIEQHQYQYDWQDYVNHEYAFAAEHTTSDQTRRQFVE